MAPSPKLRYAENAILSEITSGKNKMSEYDSRSRKMISRLINQGRVWSSPRGNDFLLSKAGNQ